MSFDMAASAESRGPGPMVVALSGALALAIAMGIGRFAFTPLLPMMLDDGVIDLHGGSTLATANYVGYLAGAIFCMLLPAFLRRRGRPLPEASRWVRVSLVATAVLTALMAWHVAPLWPVWRFAAGVISALAFVHTSNWCLGRLAALGEERLSGVIYTGPGFGIALSGLAAFALTTAGAGWMAGWLAFGAAALVLTAVIWPMFVPASATAAPASAGAAIGDHRKRKGQAVEEGMLTFAYGIAGFGYIITATFLPVIARSALPGSVWVDLFWPLFGAAVAVGALVTRLIPTAVDRRLLLLASYLTQGLGILSTLMLPTTGGFVAGSILLGLPFTTITLFGMQEVRRLRPKEPTAFMGLMTAAYGTGQIVGPPLVSVILARMPGPEAGFALSLSIAAASLFLGALIFLVMKFRFPITDM